MGRFDNCIIDVGSCFDGYLGKKAKELYKLPVIYIEPDLSTFDRLKIDDDDIKLPVAICTYDGITKFNFYQEGTHSILDTNLTDIPKYIDGFTGKPAMPKLWTAHKKTIVPCLTLKTIVEQLNVQHIQFVKIDAQGYDFEIIKSLGDKISLVDELVCEVQITDFEIYINQSKKYEVIDYMKKKGFTLVDIVKQTYDQEENLWFIRQ